MHSNGQPPSSHRGTFLMLLLGSLTAAGFFVFFLVLMGPFFLEAIILVGIFAGIGGIHYLLWGRSMSQEVAGEREEEEARAAADEWPVEESFRPRRF